jgi:hypothetical protein
VEFAFVDGVEIADLRIGTFIKNFKNRWGGERGPDETVCETVAHGPLAHP